MKGLEPRAPELESPRSTGAGVGAGSLNLAFELNICPECGWRLIEHNGLLVCEGCGLVLAPVYEPPKFKPADSGFNGSYISSGGLAQRALEALAGELDIPAGAALEVYKRLKRAGVGEAAAIALFAEAKSESVKREALEIIGKVKPYAGGRDPYLVALAAIYLVSSSFSIYGLARLAGRSPSRLHDTVRFLSSLLRGGGK